MSETLYVIPTGRVIDPDTRQPLPEKGQAVPRNTYWLRRLADGDVHERETAKPQSIKQKEK